MEKKLTSVVKDYVNLLNEHDYSITEYGPIDNSEYDAIYLMGTHKYEERIVNVRSYEFNAFDFGIFRILYMNFTDSKNDRTLEELQTLVDSFDMSGFKDALSSIGPENMFKLAPTIYSYGFKPFVDRVGTLTIDEFEKEFMTLDDL